jgi:hypothetical protein
MEVLLMIMEVVLFIGLFHHKPKPKPEEMAFSKLIEKDKKVYAEGIAGATAFEADTRYARLERPALDAYEHQLFVCSQETDDHKFDADIDVLISLGQKLMAIDDELHIEYAI